MSFRAADRFLRSSAHELEDRPALLVGLLTLAYLASAIPVAGIRPLWYDELFTRAVAGRSSVSAIWEALEQGWDLQPLPYYLLVRLGQFVGGDGELGLRLPSLLGFWMGCCGLFAIVRPYTSNLFAAAVMVLPTLTWANHYSAEARPYAVVFGFTAAALAFWQALPGRLPAIGLAVSLAAATSMHHYAFLAVLPIVAGELALTLETRRPRPTVWAALALAAVSPLLHLPVVTTGIEVYSIRAWNAPSWRVLLATADAIPKFMIIALPVAMSLVLLESVEPEAGRPRARLTRPVAAAWFGAIAIPVAGLTLAHLVSGMATERYFLGFLAGSLPLAAYALFRGTNGNLLAGLCVLLILSAAFVFRMASDVRVARNSRTELRGDLAVLTQIAYDPRWREYPIVLSDPLFAIQVAHYGSPELRSRYFYVADPEGLLRLRGWDTTDRGLLRLQRFGFPFRVWNRDELLRSHRLYLLYNRRMSTVLDRAAGGGAHVTLLRRCGPDLLFLVEENQ